MSFLSLFASVNVTPLNPQALIFSRGRSFQPLVSEDEGAYCRYFSNVKLTSSENAADLLTEISSGYGIVHLFAEVTDEGVGTSNITGTELIQQASSAGTKLLWVASSNESQAYINDFKPNGAS